MKNYLLNPIYGFSGKTGGINLKFHLMLEL
jgi:hypothetical protein